MPVTWQLEPIFIPCMNRTQFVKVETIDGIELYPIIEVVLYYMGSIVSYGWYRFVCVELVESLGIGGISRISGIGGYQWYWWNWW